MKNSCASFFSGLFFLNLEILICSVCRIIFMSYAQRLNSVLLCWFLMEYCTADRGICVVLTHIIFFRVLKFLSRKYHKNDMKFWVKHYQCWMYHVWASIWVHYVWDVDLSFIWENLCPIDTFFPVWKPFMVVLHLCHIYTPNKRSLKGGYNGFTLFVCQNCFLSSWQHGLETLWDVM